MVSEAHADRRCMDHLAKEGRVVSSSAEETRSLGRQLAGLLKCGDVVGFLGDLGAGKTCLIQGLCEELQVRDVVNSPTFILINQYVGELGGKTIPIHHFDLYRLRGEAEFNDLGPEELFEARGLCFIEWADRVEGALPVPRWELRLSHRGDDCREITWREIPCSDAPAPPHLHGGGVT